MIFNSVSNHGGWVLFRVYHAWGEAPQSLMKLTPQEDQLKAFRPQDRNYVSVTIFKCEKIFPR